MQLPWHYLINQFLNATDDNFKKMLKLSNYHNSVLKKNMNNFPADPDFANLYNSYHPEHELYVTQYTNWKVAGGNQKGKTSHRTEILSTISATVDKWNAMIKSINGFEKGSSNYITLFPQGRAPFNRGNANFRLSSVKVLAKSLDYFTLSHPEVVPVKEAVQEFFTLLDEANRLQSGAKGNFKFMRDQVNDQRIVLCNHQYGNLGFLMHKFRVKPMNVAYFFELDILRKHLQDHFTGTLQAQKRHAVLIHSFANDDEISFEIISKNPVPPNTKVTFYLATTPKGIDSSPIHVEANIAKTTIPLSDFGITNFGIHRYLTAVNNSDLELNFEVDIL